uniref:Si:dkey-117n7.5 n=1 Tax=Amphilophus citrinellus TaxID=61819 RepID=A0A3Q0SQY5_AMPCI
MDFIVNIILLPKLFAACWSSLCILPLLLISLAFFSSTSHVLSVTDRCLEPLSEGACSDYSLLWYFHAQSGECRPFVYGGCGGNQNRFSSRQECESWCDTESRGGGGPIRSHRK